MGLMSEEGLEYNLGFPGIGETQLKVLANYHYKKKSHDFHNYVCLYV